MKHSHFKIRKLDHQTQAKQSSQPNHSGRKIQQVDQLKESIVQTNQKMVALMSIFETFMKNSIQNTSVSSKQSSNNYTNSQNMVEKDVRDRYVILPLPQIEKISKEDAEKWVTQVCISTFSTSFHYYLTEQMTFQQTKVFCSQNILRNLLHLTQKFKLTDKQIQNLNEHIGQKVLPYLQKKYPLTQSNDVNKALQKQVQQTNHLDLLTNDFLYNSGIMFKYNEDGNYNDMIMNVINKAIEMAESVSLYPVEKTQKSKSQQSNYSDFQSFMSDLFENVYDQQWMIGSKVSTEKSDKQGTQIVNKANQQFNKQKYEQKVKSYTNYLIGRKISENTLPYTKEQISSKNLNIKSPAILRILTKWCQQLWQKFEKETYFIETTESIQLQDPQIINPFFKWMKTALDICAAAQKKNILAFKAELDRNSYNQQSQFLLKHLEQDGITSIPKYQKASGKFATQMVKNLHSYITLYLNRLIHGLLTISKNFHDKQVDKSWDEWQSPPNLVTFKIGDLLRCKVSSKQKQIVKLFKQIKRISNNNPNKMKIVRIKNRLKQGTNDILINVKFNKLIICQIQLQVINKSKSKFIQCSNSFCHYIYQMNRSIFGPISQLCNIWNNFQARSGIFQQLIKVPKSGDKKKLQCIQNSQHNFLKFDLPFECSQCSKLFYHNNYIISNKKCNKCNKYKCVKCQINDMDENQLKKIVFSSKKDKNISNSCKKYEAKSIPKAGVCVKIQSNFINIEIFQFIKFEGKTRLLGKKQNQIYNIQTIKSPKDTAQFLQKYCVFQITQNATNFTNMTEKIVQKFTTQSYVKQTYKQQKEVLILTQIRYSIDEMKELIELDGGYERNKKKIKRLQFASNYLTSIQYFSCFENLASINLDYNSLNDMLQISKFKKLQKLQMRDSTKLTTFNEQICELQKLQEIKISNSQLKSLPQKIDKLISLYGLKMDKNQIQTLPQNICNMINLKDISFKGNKLISLPQKIGNLVNLKRLDLKNKIKLTNLPQSFGQLISLKALDLSINKFTVLPDHLKYLSKLQILKLEQNQLQTIPQTILSNESLKVLILSQNKLKNLPNTFNGCKNLTSLALYRNQIAELPQTLKYCTNLQLLSLWDNKMSKIPDWFDNFKKLPTIINFKKNCLTQFPKYIFELEKVTQLILQQNQIITIPPDITKLQQIKVLKLNKNKIKQLTPQLAQIKTLASLQIKYNQIQSAPIYTKDIAPISKNPAVWGSFFAQNKIKSLQSNELLDLMGQNISFTSNLLESIPMNSIVNKQNILSINFSKNKIKQIPRDIKLFVNLNKLILQNNLIEVIPKQIEELTKIVKSGLQFNNNPIRQVECFKFCQEFSTRQTIKWFTAKSITQPIKDTNKGDFDSYSNN